jgi:hypothetical protein
VTAGLSSTSFRLMASALRYSASASYVLSIDDSRLPRFIWLSAR